MAKYDGNAPISVWVGNLGKYNEGELVGEWFSLPCEDFEDEWEQLMKAIGIGSQRWDGGVYEEVFCADWECNIPGLEYSEYPDYEELNNIAEEWESLHDWEQEAIQVRMNLCGEDFYEAQNRKDDVRIWHACINMTDVAYEYIDECGLLHDVPDHLQNYFDYEAFGRYMQIEGCFDYSEELCCMVEAY